MKLWKWALAGLVLLTVAGCRTDPAIPVLERELRLKEDEIYRLRATLEDAQDCDPSSCSDYSTDDYRSSSREPEGGTGSASGTRRHRRRGSSATNGIKPPVAEIPSQPTTEFPKALETPAGALPPGVPEVPANIQNPSKPLDLPENGPDGRSSKRPIDPNGPMLERDSDRVSSRSGRMTMASRSASARPFTPSSDSRAVAMIALNRVLTGGISANAGAGDHGLLVVVEPRDRQGRTIDAPAEMSVVVLDPALEGNAARVARWDLTPAECASLFRRTGSRQAIHVTTTWPDDPPVHNKLHLFVRYVTVDGRKLQADQPIEVALPGDQTARWNQSDDATDPATPKSRQHDETPTAGVPTPAPHIATRSDETKPRRPVWSPERR